MRHLFLFILLFIKCYSVFPQTTFAEIDTEIKDWYDNISNSVSIASPKSLKSIDFPAQHYSITGVISKGVLSEGTIARFYNTSSIVPELLLEGKVSYSEGRLIINGIKYNNTSTTSNKIYGAFYVYNMEDFSMNFKLKKNGALKIKCSNALYLDGTYLERRVIVKLFSIRNASVFVDKKNDESFTFMANVPKTKITLNDDDSFDLAQILLLAKDNVTMHMPDGSVFKGNVRPIMGEKDSISYTYLDGELTDMKSGPKKISVKHENGDVVYTWEDDIDNPLLSKEVLYVKDDGTFPEDSLWDMDKIKEHCYHAKWIFKNGNYFEGTIKSTIKDNGESSVISSVPISGIFKYSNGDRFEGDLVRSVGPFYVDGTTYFFDGSISKGNWMEKYRLTNKQWEKVNSCNNPSEARNLIEKLVYNQKYQDYDYPDDIIYFTPETYGYKGHFYFRTSSSKITYDKTNKYFTSGTTLRFAVDDNGYRKWEIVYNNNIPQYLNEYTWYENGTIESIKSYHYDTKEIYIICHFFTDGKLRSAYQYGRGNKGKNVLRRSKESHPTLGLYSCKQYDLDGKYERSISWGIGEEPYGLFVYRFSPNRLIFNKMTPVE